MSRNLAIVVHITYLLSDLSAQSFRIIDCRYAYEYADGHIKYAENWQHGEDEEFIKEFLPDAPLLAPPTYDPNSHKKRDILIFHCEFSSKRGPDFYKKLRERYIATTKSRY